MGDVLYTAEATARGGREGEVVSSDGVLDLLLALPPEMGGRESGEHTNPEQMFAAGYAACFHSALKMLAGQRKQDITGSSITAQVSLVAQGKLFELAVVLTGKLPTLDAQAGHELMEAAHEVCPYSRGTRGNVPVTLELA